MLPISDITKFSFQDFPNRTSCIVWFCGCNFRCPYCHNPDFIEVKPEQKFLTEMEIFNFLQQRVGLLEGVVLSGGEVSLYNIYDFVCKIKEMGFLVKIDTNGTNPTLIKQLVNEKKIDFVALDYKAPKAKFFSITNNNDYEKFDDTLSFLIKSGIEMEIRTTIHTKLLDENDINLIIDDLINKGYNSNYAIQNFRNNKTLANIGEQERVLDKSLIRTALKIEWRNF
ncbi:MAG: anaerobic ribonucleoside-triphosphate reductase activating protein [Rickettsiales bacterium]|nr:MAG: anaerobic ribonucleoside-triphosphate reductase activating protein [Rickettsiales bacterium]